MWLGRPRGGARQSAGQGGTGNAICPGCVQTHMVETLKTGYAQATGSDGDTVVASVLGRVPMGRILEADETASLAVHLLSRESSGMTGQSLLVDGGLLTCER